MEKTSDARLAEESRDLGDRREELFAASCLRVGWTGAKDLSLCLAPAGDGRRFRILALVDDFSRECLGLVADNSLSGVRVARELDRIAIQRGYPSMIVSDNGTELTSHAILQIGRAHV